MADEKVDIKKLLAELDILDKEIVLHNGISGILQWDQSTHMPKAASELRSKQLSYMQLKSHEMITSPRLVFIVSELKKKENYAKLDKLNQRKIYLYDRKISYNLKLPKKHVEEMAELESKLYTLWVESKKKDSFKSVIPLLSRMFELKRQEAKYIDPKKKPYDVFLDNHEEGTNMAMVDKIFSELRDELIKILNKITKSKDYAKINSDSLIKLGKFDEDNQWKVCEDLCKRILHYADKYDLTKTPHPFMSSASIDDCRVTSAIREDPMFSFGSTAHECGHAVFAMNHGKQLDGSILGGPEVGLALHESQSRLWENIICNGEYFWKGYYPYYQSLFSPLKNVPLERFYKIINTVQPSLIRIESDELTYCLHIIIRYELEKGLIEGSIKVENLDKEWNKKYKEYLGIIPDKPSRGVLQDVHWYSGLVGYFHTYALGNILSATIYNAALKQNPKLNDQISKLQFDDFRNWLIKNIYVHGSSKSTEEIIRNACGKYYDINDYANYLKNKYYNLYNVKE
ncbi:MAG TPA: carboxypeptidase M32 [Alphaproteobacteria bacterium]|nr:carboxypeptidase M32 [Alphaproteobacteria bacterium]